MECTLQYIPERLHNNIDREIISKYSVGDIIYRRSSERELNNPFASISLYEISNNIGSNCLKIISLEKDVLYNILKDNRFETYDDKVVCTLKIKSLNEDYQYFKVFNVEKNQIKYKCTLALIHDPIPCMYPHCLFRIILNNEVVVKDNYNDTLKRIKELRTKIRHELATMVYRRSIEC